MNRCLSPDEIIDAVDGALGTDRRAHLTTCAACQHAAADVRDALARADLGAVPEPPAAFWPSINARVREAIADDTDARGWRAVWRWEVVVPLAGLTLVVVALASAVDGVVPRTGDLTASDPAALTTGERLPADAALDDDALALVEDLAALLPEGGWDALGVTRLPDLDVAAAALSADEQAALAALLQSAVERPKS